MALFLPHAPLHEGVPCDQDLFSALHELADLDQKMAQICRAEFAAFLNESALEDVTLYEGMITDFFAGIFRAIGRLLDWIVAKLKQLWNWLFGPSSKPKTQAAPVAMIPKALVDSSSPISVGKVASRVEKSIALFSEMARSFWTIISPVSFSTITSSSSQMNFEAMQERLAPIMEKVRNFLTDSDAVALISDIADMEAAITSSTTVPLDKAHLKPALESLTKSTKFLTDVNKTVEAISHIASTIAAATIVKKKDIDPSVVNGLSVEYSEELETLQRASHAFGNGAGVPDDVAKAAALRSMTDDGRPASAYLPGRPNVPPHLKKHPPTKGANNTVSLNKIERAAYSKQGGQIISVMNGYINTSREMSKYLMSVHTSIGKYLSILSKHIDPILSPAK